MELVYIWIDNYKSIHQEGFNLSPKFQFQYNTETDSLHLAEQDILPQNFWGDNVLNLTLILGKNGSGKTSILEFLDQPYLRNGIFVFYEKIVDSQEGTSGKLTIRHHKDLLKGEVSKFENYEILQMRLNDDGSGGKIENHENYFHDIKKIFYTPIFRGDTAGIFNMDTYFRPMDYMSDRSKGNSLGKKNQSSIDISTDSELYKCHWYMKRSDSGQNPFYLYNVNQTHEHLWFLTDKRFLEARDIIFNKKLPELEISPKTTQLSPSSFKEDNFKGIIALFNGMSELISEEDNDVTKFVYHCLFELIKEFVKDAEHINETMLHDFIKLDVNQLGIREIYFNAVKFLDDKQHERLNEIPKILEKFAKKFWRNIQHDGRVIILDINSFEQLKAEPLFNFEKSYATSVNYRWTGLSTGELLLLTFLGRFYKTSITFNFSKVYHIFIDEGETSLHPHWQKQYISWILKYLPMMFPKGKIQLVVTSNNPIIASDIPNCNIIRLKTENGKTKVLPNKAKTFGANIYDLFKDSFFIEDGFMGDFAKDKINETIQWLETKNEHTEAKKDYYFKLIQTIGEPLLRDKLEEMYNDSINNEFMVEKMKRKIKYLQEIVDKLENPKEN